PEDPHERAAALRRSLSMLEVAPLRVTAPAMASTWLAPLVTLFGADMPKYLPWMWSDGRAGVYGVRKSSLAALCQAHAGAGYSSSDADLLPAAETTLPALTGYLGARKDSILWLDDYKPGESGPVQTRTQAVMEAAIRQATNRQKRVKAQRGARGAAPALNCYAILAVTAECLPLFESGSTHDRVFAWQVHPGDVDLDRLTVLQDAQDERAELTLAGSVYLDWLARNHDRVAPALRPRFRELRAEFAAMEGVSGRACSHMAHMVVGAETFTACMVDSGAMTEADRAAVVAAIRSGLLEARRGTDAERAEEHTDVVWLELLRAALASGDVYAASTSGGRPAEHAEALGWSAGSDFPRGRTLIGYARDEGLALIPASAERAVSALAKASDRKIPIKGVQLRRKLVQGGVILPADPDSDGKHEHLHRARADGRSPWCMVVPWEVYTGAADPSPAAPPSAPKGGSRGGT